MTTFVQGSRSQAVLARLHNSVQYVRAQAMSTGRPFSASPFGADRWHCGEDWTLERMALDGIDAARRSTAPLRITNRVSTDVSIIVSTHSLSFNRPGELAKSALADDHRLAQGTAFKFCQSTHGDGDACTTNALSGELTIEAGGSAGMKRS